MALRYQIWCCNTSGKPERQLGLNQGAQTDLQPNVNNVTAVTANVACSPRNFSGRHDQRRLIADVPSRPSKAEFA
jgi:hypothetical protein